MPCHANRSANPSQSKRFRPSANRPGPRILWSARRPGGTYGDSGARSGEAEGVAGEDGDVSADGQGGGGGGGGRVEYVGRGGGAPEGEVGHERGGRRPRPRPGGRAAARGG